MQLLRTPKGKKTLLDIYNEAYKKTYDENLENILLANELFKVLDDNIKSVLLESLLNEYGHIAIGLNETEIPFITSDNPVVLLPNLWNEYENMMFYPITPNRCIFFLKRKYVNSQMDSVLTEVLEGKFLLSDFSEIPQEAYKREKTMLKQLNPETIALKTEDILVLNSCCVKCANRYVISNQNMKEEKSWINC